MSTQTIVVGDEATADISVEPGFTTSTGEVIPTRVRLDAWSCGDGASMYLTPHEARLLSNALWSAATTAEGPHAPPPEPRPEAEPRPEKESKP